MNLLCTHRNETEKSAEYATSAHFGKLFVEDMTSLYVLSYLLTADHQAAEQCFVSGFEDCVQGGAVFQEWARSWSCRSIVHNAIRMMSSHAGFAAGTSAVVDPAAAEGQPKRMWKEDIAFAGVLSLGNFERFVFVLSVLEKYPDLDCAVLLGCSRKDVRDGRARACQQLADFELRTAVPADDFSGATTS